MKDITVTFRGVDEVSNTLESLPPKIQGKIMIAALKAGGNIVRRAYQKRIPVRHATGHGAAKLVGRKGSTVAYRMPGWGRASVIVRRKPGSQGDWVEAGASRRAFYLRILEFGTRYISPRGWLKAAWEETKAAALARISGELMIQLEKLAARTNATGKLK